MGLILFASCSCLNTDFSERAGRNSHFKMFVYIQERRKTCRSKADDVLKVKTRLMEWGFFCINHILLEVIALTLLGASIFFNWLTKCLLLINSFLCCRFRNLGTVACRWVQLSYQPCMKSVRVGSITIIRTINSGNLEQCGSTVVSSSSVCPN
jgi:hypothetical protein